MQQLEQKDINEHQVTCGVGALRIKRISESQSCTLYFGSLLAYVLPHVAIRLKYSDELAFVDRTSTHPKNHAEYIVKKIRVKCLKCNQCFHLDTEAACESLGNEYGRRTELFEFVANMLPIVIIKKYLEYHVFANQNLNDKTNKNDVYYKLYKESLKNPLDEVNIEFGCGGKEVNKFVQSNKHLLLHEPHCTSSQKLKEMTLQCTTLFSLIIAAHVDIIVEQGVSCYA